MWGRSGALALLAFSSVVQAENAPGPVTLDQRYLGKWLGEAGFPQDRVALGLELSADAKGTIAGHVFIPVGNLYDFPLPGTFVRDGDRLVDRDWHMSLRLDGASLVGQMFFNKVPFTLKRTSVLPNDGPVPPYPGGPQPKWSVKLGSPIYARAAISGSTIYVGTGGGMFFAIRALNGSYAWAFSAGRPIFGEALPDKDGVYFVCDNGYLFKLDPATGHELWRADIGDARTSRILPHPIAENSGDFDWDIRAPRPVLVDGAVLVGSGDGNVYAIDDRSGKTLWTVDTKDRIRGEVLVDGARAYAGNSSGKIIAIDPRRGRVLWEKNIGAEITSSMSLVDRSLIVGSRDGLLAAIDSGAGTVLWATQLWGSSSESTAVASNSKTRTFYIGSSDMRRVSMIDASDGRVAWRTDVLGWAWAAPTLLGGTLYQSAIGADPYRIRLLGGLVAIDADDGHVLWRWASPQNGSWLSGLAASPSVAGGRLIVGGLDGSLYAFDLGSNPH